MNDQLYEYYNLGLGDPIAISSTNMLGLGDLLEEIVKRLPPPTPDEAEEEGTCHPAGAGGSAQRRRKAGCATGCWGRRRAVVS